MLTLYRRHSKDCGRTDRYYKRCQCAMWVEGTLDRQYMRKSLHTQSWERARAIVDGWEKTGAPKARPDVPTIRAAFLGYKVEMNERNLSEQSQDNHDYIIARFVNWCEANNFLSIDEVTTDCIRQFFAERELASSTRATERRAIKALMNYAIAQNWIKEDPTKALPKIIVRSEPTDWLDKEQFQELLDAIKADLWLTALVLTLRWSGLRIADGLTLERSRIDHNGVLMLTQHKTKTPVSVPLPGAVLEALDSLPVNGRRFFIPDTDKPKNHAMRVRALLTAAPTSKHVHPHMLRDTFAIELLLAGVPLEHVSKLLGHKSIQTTEKHYAHWVRERQEMLNAAVRQAWG